MLVLRDPSRWALGVFVALWIGISVAVLASDVRRGSGLSGAGSAVMFLIPAVLFALFTKQMWHPAILTQQELQVPSILHDRHIPIADIAGVGICLISGGRSSSWCTTVWTTEGRRIYVLHHLWAGWNIARSQPAKQAIELWQAVAGLQGSSGPLVTRALQHTEGGSGWSMISRIYCPDDGSVRRP